MKALILAGGLPQIELLKQIRQRNITTILADGNDRALARPYADRFYQVNIFDIEAVKEIALREEVDFLITCCADQVLLVVAQVSEMLGLPCYLDYKTAQEVSDKERMKRIFVENNVPTSRHVVMARLDMEAIGHLRYPLIVKPVDAYSSRGVRKVFGPEELAGAFEDAVSISRSGTAIVEEFCSGEEISVDLFVEDGQAHVLCITNSEKVRDEDRFVIFRGRYPARVSEALEEEIRVVCQRIADAFGIRNAPMLVQMITDGESVSVLEFCARTGGAMKYRMIYNTCGVDVIKAVVDLTLGIRPEIRVQKPPHRYVVNDFIYCRQGVFDRLDGFDALVEEGTLKEYYPLRPKGFVFSGLVSSSSDRIAGVTIVADSLEEFNRKHRRFVEKARVLDAEGNDLMLHELLPDLE